MTSLPGAGNNNLVTTPDNDIERYTFCCVWNKYDGKCSRYPDHGLNVAIIYFAF